jgi:hypothetical protein
MKKAQQDETICRRTFVTTASASAAALFFTGCELGPGPGRFERNGAPGIFYTLELDARVPARMLLPAGSSADGVLRLVSIRDIGGSRVRFRFSNDHEIVWDRTVSFLTEVHKNRGRVTRCSVALKVVAAYTLDEVARQLKRKLSGRVAEALRRNPEDRSVGKLLDIGLQFVTFQEQDVLDVVSMGALYDLVAAVDALSNSLTHVSWDEGNNGFSVS